MRPGLGFEVWDLALGSGVWDPGSGIKDPKIARGGGGCRFTHMAVAKDCSSRGARNILAPISGSRLRGPKVVFLREESKILGPEVVELHQFLTPTCQNTR